MEAIVLILSLLLLAVLLNLKIDKIKNITEDNSLDYITKKLPSNKIICQEILKSFGKNIEIEEDNKSNNSMYIVVTDKILLGKMKNDWVRVQTIAHECVHSTQDRRILLGNFILSNLCRLYFFISCVLVLFGICSYLNLYILIIVVFLSIFIRNYLETNAMTKAEFVAEKYLETTDLTKEEKEKLIGKYNELNKFGIPFANYINFAKEIIKPLVYAILVFIFMWWFTI